MSADSDSSSASQKQTSVFLSYSRDDRAKALPVIASLEASGCSVWWDGLLAGGDAFAHTTEQALETADAVVVLWSERSVQSHWVRDEATSGRDRGRMVPVSIDGTQPPLGFRQIHYIDLSKWRGKAGSAEFAQLLRAIQATAAAPRRQLTFNASAPAAVPRRRLLAGGAAAVAAAGAGGLAWKAGWLGSGSAARENSVAVLPFRNLSGDPDENYFAEGLSEQVRTVLSRNNLLRVIAPASTIAAKELGGSAQQVAGKLGAAYVLDGSVRRSGALLRITASLSEAASGAMQWTEQFDRKLADVFAVQEEIAEAAAAAMSAQAAPASAGKAGERGGTGSIAAYEAYLRGNAYYALRSGEASTRAALAQYDAALEFDPDFAEAHAARSRMVVALTSSFGKASEFAAAYDSAVASARKAVELAPQLAITHSSLGYALISGKLDFRGAARPYERARALGAGDASVMSGYAGFCANSGRKADAAKALTIALNLDPLNPGMYRTAAFVTYLAREFPGSSAHCRKALSLNPRMSRIHGYLGDNHYMLGNPQEARREYIAESVELFRLAGLAIAENRIGNAGAAQEALAQLISAQGDASTYQQAQILAQWGRLDEAVTKLLFARQIGDVGLAMSKVDPLLDPLRKIPAFSQLLAGLGLG